MIRDDDVDSQLFGKETLIKSGNTIVYSDNQFGSQIICFLDMVSLDTISISQSIWQPDVDIGIFEKMSDSLIHDPT